MFGYYNWMLYGTVSVVDYHPSDHTCLGIKMEMDLSRYELLFVLSSVVKYIPRLGGVK